MDAEDVQITLKRIHSDLDRVFKSRGFLHILNQTQEPNSLDNSLGSALYFITESKLRVNRILQKHKERTDGTI
jgi:hypothetical protein